MPYRYFGRTNQHFGKPLWEILMNLKNFGKGRLVTKSAITHEYPQQPSFYRIVDVLPHMLEYPDDFRGNIFVEEVFCGRKRAEIIDIGVDARLADYRLIHKSEEGEILRKVEEFLANPENHVPVVRPKTAPLPPVWKLVIAREMKISPSEVPEIPIIYNDPTPELMTPTRLANDGEEPDFKIGPGHFKPTHEEFYEHVVLNREEANAKYCTEAKPDPDFAFINRHIPALHLEKKKPCSPTGQTISS